MRSYRGLVKNARVADQKGGRMARRLPEVVLSRLGNELVSRQRIERITETEDNIEERVAEV